MKKIKIIIKIVINIKYVMKMSYKIKKLNYFKCFD